MTLRRHHPPTRKRKVAVILSGGGARGAYEVGVLSYVLDSFARIRGAAPRFDILCGTSVGAINACFLAAHLSDDDEGWTNVALGKKRKNAYFSPPFNLGLMPNAQGGAQLSASGTW